jgi:hypothetical protein
MGITQEAESCMRRPLPCRHGLNAPERASERHYSEKPVIFKDFHREVRLDG